MGEKIKVFISSPYTIPVGHQEKNVLKSFKVFKELLNLGFIPFAPLTAHYIQKHHATTYEQWMDYDIEWLKCCDCVLRLPGESTGADYETEIARLRNIPVFTDIRDVVNFRSRLENYEE